MHLNPVRNTLQKMLVDDLSCFVVYFNPRDYPGEWVVRQWQINLDRDIDTLLMPTDYAIHVGSLEEARRAIVEAMPDAVCMPRHDEDEPQIWETWV